MPLERFKAIVDTLPMSNALCLQGVGESTLHPEFAQMVKYAKDSGKYAFLTLNTNLLTHPTEYYRKLKEYGLNHISVSVDSLNQDVAEACRKGTKVDKLHQRVKELVALYAPTRLSISIVASKRNLHDIPHTLRLLNRIGPMEVGIQPLIIYDQKKGVDGNNPYALDKEDVTTIHEFVELPYHNLTISFTQNENRMHQYRCTRPFLSPYITAAGYLTPCCTVEDPAILGFTQVGDRPFDQIWKEPQLQSWLRDYAMNASEICRGCCFFTG